MEFTFTLTEMEANIMLNALLERPYREVADLINKIDAQAREQRNNAKQAQNFGVNVSNPEKAV